MGRGEILGREGENRKKDPKEEKKEGNKREEKGKYNNGGDWGK